jgi:hypothetical protein
MAAQSLPHVELILAGVSIPRSRLQWSQAGRLGNLTGHKPIEKHPDGREMLFDCRDGAPVLFNIRSNDDRLDLPKIVHSVLLTPKEKLTNSFSVGGTSISISNSYNKKFNKLPASLFTGSNNNRRQLFKTGSGEIPTAGHWHEIGAHSY